MSETMADHGLREQRRRLVTKNLMAHLIASELVLLTLASSLLLISRPAKEMFLPAATLTLLLGLLPPLLWLLRSYPSLATTAALLDRENQTNDRFSTALELSGAPASSPITRLALQEIDAHFRNSHSTNVPGCPPGSMLPWLVVPLVMFALAFLMPTQREQGSGDNTSPVIAERTAQKIEALATQAEQLAAAAKKPPLEKLISEARRQAEIIRHSKSLPEILSKISALQDEADVAGENMAGLDPTQKEALKEALSQALGRPPEPMNPTTDQSLEAIAQQAAEAADPGAVANAASTQLDQNSSLTPKQREELQQMLDDAANAQSQQETSEQLSQMGDSSEGDSSIPDAMSEDLQSLKDGLRQPEGDKGEGEGALASLIQQALIAAIPPSQPGEGEGGGGGAGSEMDKGTTDTPLGDAATQQNPADGSLRIDGNTGDGPELSALLRKAGSDEKARREYEFRLRRKG